MRELSTIQKREKLNRVFAVDKPGNGGAHHEYLIVSDLGLFVPKETKIQFQNGARKEELTSISGVLDKKYYGDRIMKYCAEIILVHELLHCKMNWISNNDTYEGKYFDTVEHALLEQMAKSLIMAKYNVGLEYFKG